MNVALVILAAGDSSRLGRPKQLVRVLGTTLLRRAAVTACASRAADVIAVFGYDSRVMHAELEGLRARVLENPDWREGISSSVRAAVRGLLPVTDGVLFVTCDQPRLTVDHLNALIDAFERAPDSPVASGYGGTAGVPVLFPRALFGELLSLEGDRGAQRVALAHERDLVVIPWPDGTFDVDTPPDVSAHL